MGRGQRAQLEGPDDGAGPELTASPRQAGHGGTRSGGPGVAAGGRRPRAVRGAHLEPATLLLVAAAYAAWASSTSPFTVPADVAVSIPGATFVAALVLQRRWPDGPWRRLPRARPPRVGGAAGWLVGIALLVGVELAAYFHGGPRASYPTISSAGHALFRWRAARAAGWFGWLGTGWFLARR